MGGILKKALHLLAKGGIAFVGIPFGAACAGNGENICTEWELKSSLNRFSMGLSIKICDEIHAIVAIRVSHSWILFVVGVIAAPFVMI